MPNLLLPSQIDNTYRGNRLALVVLGLIAALKAVMGFNMSGLNPFVSTEQVLTSVDGIPLDQFPPEAARMVVSSTQDWALLLLLVAGLSLLALVRYRAMVPLMLLVLTAEQVLRIGMSIAQAPDAPWIEMDVPSLLNWSMTGLLVAALALSLIPAKSRGPSRPGSKP